MKDIVLYLLTVLVAIVPLVKEVRKKKKSWIYVSFIFMCFVLILWLGVDKIIRDNEAEKNDQTVIRNLDTQLKKIKESYSHDSLKDIQFQNTLKSKFRIGRDSLTNQPYLIRTQKLEINSNTGTNFGIIGGANNQVTNQYGPKPRDVTKEILKEITRKMPNKSISIAILSRVSDQESNEFKVKLKDKLIQSGYKNVFISGTINDMIIGDDQANLKKQKEYTVTLSDGQYNIAIPGNQ